MPTLSGIIGLVLVLLPGIPGAWLHGKFVGVSWRESEIQYFIRLLAYSALGFSLYAVLAGPFGLPLPEYVSPFTYADQTWLSQLPRLAVAYLGHFAASGVVGAVVGLAVGRVARDSHRDAWHDFVRSCAPKHWIVVTLKNGESYAGQLAYADISVAPDFRDVVLTDPARWEDGNYIASTQQHLYIPASAVYSVAVVANKDDDRLIQSGEKLFPESAL